MFFKLLKYTSSLFIFLRLNKNEVSVFKTCNNVVLIGISRLIIFMNLMNIFSLNRMIVSLCYKWLSSNISSIYYKAKNWFLFVIDMRVALVFGMILWNS